MAHLPKIALALEHLHHFDRPELPFPGQNYLKILSTFPSTEAWHNTAAL
jgi:hypothetical protein